MYSTHIVLCYLSLKQDFIALVAIPTSSLFCLALFCLKQSATFVTGRSVQTVFVMQLLRGFSV